MVWRPSDRTGRRAGSLADRPLLIELVAGHAAVDGPVERIVGRGPHDHPSAVPDLVALLQERKVKRVLHVRVDRVDLALRLRQLVHHAHQHEDLVTLTAAVEETLAAPEPEGHVLAVPVAADAANDALRVDGRHKHGVLDGAEGPNEWRRLEVLVELDDSKDVLRLLVDNGEAHVTAQLLVGLLGKVLWVHDGALCADAPVPVGVDEAQVVGVAGHQRLHVLRHRLGVQLKILRQHTPPMAVVTPGLELAWGRCREGAGQLRPPCGHIGCPEGAACGTSCKGQHAALP
mmetsp:Transcript_47160/g.106035  ORF Transcript_47160/g.106035 Transcript_47160/m.106035 type:complete len:288 (+) Transcript_47160:49-912(+)